MKDFFRRIQWWRSKVETRTGRQSNRQSKMAEKSRVTTPRGRHESLVPGVSSLRLRPDSDQSRIWCRAQPWLVCDSLNELTWLSFVVHWHLTIFFFFFFFFFFRGAGRYFALVRQNERGVRGPPPGKFWNLRWLKPPNFNSWSSTQDTNQSGSYQNNCWFALKFFWYMSLDLCVLWNEECDRSISGHFLEVPKLLIWRRWSLPWTKALPSWLMSRRSVFCLWTLRIIRWFSLCCVMVRNVFFFFFFQRNYWSGGRRTCRTCSGATVFFVVSRVLFDKTVTEYRVWHKVHGTAEEVRCYPQIPGW